MSILSVLAITPLKAYVGLSFASATLALGFRGSSEVRLLSALISCAAFVLIYACVDATQYQDYASYQSWLRLAEVRLYEHMDKGFGLIMLCLSTLSTEPWIFILFVPMTVALVNAISARSLGASVSLFFLMVLFNPRVHEFVFNSTRAALAISVIVGAYVLWIKGRHAWAVVVAVISLSLHLVIGTVCLAILLLGFLGPLGFSIALFVMGSLFLILGIYPEPLYAWPREQLTELVLFTKGDAIDEYLFDSIQGGAWLRCSLWIYCSGLVACGACLYRKLDEIGQWLIKGALVANGVGLLFMSLVPIVARVHFLAILLAAMALARSQQAREGKLDFLIVTVLGLGVLSLSKNMNFMRLI
ncbi:EpsG family protein [Aquabacterium sp.]|uniref:EpsG family protein n=1 Tax=Aquabacterium sp. TaxID=1872578 RepID=UPI002488F904|nr:EpsG family protein [Aquabacterium sp.]MDI1259389.1 EpsG family protein [Aquabacterium sp.]